MISVASCSGTVSLHVCSLHDHTAKQRSKAGLQQGTGSVAPLLSIIMLDLNLQCNELHAAFEKKKTNKQHGFE